MKEIALEYLTKDRIHHMDMIIAIEDGGEIIAASKEGVLVRSIDNVAMISCLNRELVQTWIAFIKDCTMVVIHQIEDLPSIKQVVPKLKEMHVYQCLYPKKQITLQTRKDIYIDTLDVNYFDIVKKWYSIEVEDEYLITQLQSKYFYGAFIEKELVGFIGLHAEKSIGFIEILPAYRRKGIASYLESYMINELLKDGNIPYAQIEVDNEQSIQLHKKLGFLFSQQKIVWLL